MDKQSFNLGPNENLWVDNPNESAMRQSKSVIGVDINAQNEKVEEEKEEDNKTISYNVPTIHWVNEPPQDNEGKTNKDDNPLKTWNFSRWSDTQLEDGTCSMSFLKLCKNDEEKKKYMEQERIKLQNLLKQEIMKKNSNKESENPFAINKNES